MEDVFGFFYSTVMVKSALANLSATHALIEFKNVGLNSQKYLATNIEYPLIRAGQYQKNW